MNKKGSVWLGFGIALAVIVFIVMIFAGAYNGLVAKDTNVENMWGRVQTAYQRRADLIPNLVETVKGAKDFEQETQTQIAELRSLAGQAQTQMQSADDVGEIQAAEGQMNTVLSRLLVIVEAYPELKANENFLALQDELAGTENRVKWERDEYNNAVTDYKKSVRSFPTNMLAGGWGFFPDKWDMFDADEGSQNAPKVDFE